MAQQSRTIIATGGAGFIGSNFIMSWLQHYPEGRVVNLDRLSYAGNLANLTPLGNDPRHVFVKGDIGNVSLVQELLRRFTPDAIIHFAAESHVDRSIQDPTLFVEANICGTFHLLMAAREYWEGLSAEQQESFRFLHVSTDEVYGSLGPEDPPFREDTPYAPNSPYSASKAAADHLVRAWHHTYGLPVLTTNCSNNYGPRQYPEKLIPLVITRALSGKYLPVYGNGCQIRDWLYVEDHCNALRLVLEQGRIGEAYNIGGEEEHTNLEVVQTICNILDELHPTSCRQGHKNLIRHVTDRPGHDRRYAMDISKIRQELGWQPRESFLSGIRRTVQWYLRMHSQRPQRASKHHFHRNLYLSS